MDFLVINLLQFGHGLLDGDDLSIFFLNYPEKLPPLGIKELSAFLFLFSLSEQGLWS